MRASVLPSLWLLCPVVMFCAACGQPEAQSADGESASPRNKITTSPQGYELPAQGEPDSQTTGDGQSSRVETNEEHATTSSQTSDINKGSTPSQNRQIVLSSQGKLEIGAQSGVTKQHQIEKLTELLGKPDNQSNTLCLAEILPQEGESITWGSLTIYISRGAFAHDGHEYSADDVIGYSYSVTARQAGPLRTREGIGLDSSLTDAQRAYPAGQLVSVGTKSWFRVNANNMVLELAGSGEDSSVRAIHSGFSCDVAS